MRSGITIDSVARSSAIAAAVAGVDVEAELGGEARGAQHPQRIVAEADPRVGRGAQPAAR